MRSLKFVPAVVLLVAFLSSCNRYIDTVNGSNQVEQGSLKFYADRNLLTYGNNIVGTRDREKIYPRFFEVALPKKMKYYEFIGSSDFGFYYDKAQVFFFQIELEPKHQNKDTLYSPSQEELKALVRSLKTNAGKYDVKKISAIEGRRNVVLVKGDATILLYNILEKNYSQFLDDVNTFKFIK